MMKQEEESMDASDGESSSALALPSNCVVSSTRPNLLNNNGISGPLRKTLEAHMVGSALVEIGRKIQSGATSGSSSISGINLGANLEATTSQLSSILGQMTGMERSVRGSASTKSSGSDGSNSASPMSLNGGRGSKRGPKPRAADSPGSGSTTSTTNGVGRSGDRQFKCGICDRAFGYKHVLQNHERTHTGEKPFECIECKKRFTRDHHLKTHMRLHTGEKPYSCPHCDRQFVQVANLRRHLRVHTGERPYSCETCESKFSDSNQLKAHVLIHKNEKPFSCLKCHGKFRRRHHMMNHKCPSDESNLNRARRGRRPRAYDDLNSPSPLPFRLELTGQNPPSPPSVPNNPVGLLAQQTMFTNSFAALTLPNLLSIRNDGDRRGIIPHAFSSLSPPPAHSATSTSDQMGPVTVSTKSRRKPKTTMRILTPEQREMFLLDRDGVQTQPLNLGVGRSNRSTHANKDVLDLSSRSKSDMDSDREDDGWKDDEDLDDMDMDHSCDEYQDDDDPQDLSSRSTNGNGNGKPFNLSAYHLKDHLKEVKGGRGSHKF